MIIALIACLGVLSVTALAGIGWSMWLVTNKMDSMGRDFATAITQMKLASDNLATTLVLGYRDSPPTSEPPSTESSESEIENADVNNWDDMPDHIRDHYLREQMEDSLMATPSSTLS